MTETILTYEEQRLERLEETLENLNKNYFSKPYDPSKDPFHDIEVMREKKIDEKRASYGPAVKQEEWERQQFALIWGED